LKVDHWKGRRFFALYDGNELLVAVFVYRKGAEAVETRLRELQEAIARFENEREGVGDDDPYSFLLRSVLVESARRGVSLREKPHATASPPFEKQLTG